MTIVAAAICINTRLIFHVEAPGRHHHVLHKMAELALVQAADWEEGFITDRGLFLSRIGAMHHVELCRQKRKPRGPTDYKGPELFSEDLW